MQYGMTWIIILHRPSDPDTLSLIVFPSKPFAKFKRISENMAKDNANGHLFPWTTVMWKFWKRQIWHHEKYQPKAGTYSLYSLCHNLFQNLFSSAFIASSLCPYAFRPQTWFRRSDFQILFFMCTRFIITIGQWNPHFRSKELCYLLDWGSMLQQMFSRCVLV